MVKIKSFSSSLQYFESHRQSKFWQQYCSVYGTALGAILKHDSCGLRGLPSELVAHVGEWIYGHSRCPKLDNKFPWRIYWYDSQQDIYCYCWGNKFSQFSRGTVAAVALFVQFTYRAESLMVQWLRFLKWNSSSYICRNENKYFDAQAFVLTAKLQQEAKTVL